MFISQQNKSALRNPWMLGIIGFLTVVISVNSFFIYQAFKQPPNLVVDNFYERGKVYQQRKAALKEERQLGWTGLIIAPPSSRVNQLQSYEVLIQGENSTRVDLDSVTFFAYRPSDMRADFVIEMSEVSAGRYTAEIAFNLPGNWDLIVEANRGEDEFLITRRVYIDP